MLSVVLTLGFVAIMLYALSKKMYAQTILFLLAGVAMIIWSLVTGNSMMGDTSCGNLILDVFEYGRGRMISAFTGIGVTICGRWFFATFYRPEYMASVPSLNLLIWSTLFSHLAVSRSTWLVCEGLNHYSEMFPIWGVLVNLVLNALLIPGLGATGAAAATLVTQFVVTMIAPLFYKPTRPCVKHMCEAFFARDLIARIKGLKK